MSAGRREALAVRCQHIGGALFAAGFACGILAWTRAALLLVGCGLLLANVGGLILLVQWLGEWIDRMRGAS